MKIAFFEEVLTIRPHNTVDGLFAQCLDKLPELSHDAKTQISFLFDLLCNGTVARDDKSIQIVVDINYMVRLDLTTLNKGAKTIKGLYNLGMYDFTYEVQDDFTAITNSGEVVCILPFNIED